MWSNGFQRRLELVAPDGGAAALLTALPAAAAAGSGWLYLDELLPRVLGTLALLLLGLALALRAIAGRSQRRVQRAVLEERGRWELSTAAGECSHGKLLHGWELRFAGPHGLIALGWSTPAGYRHLIAFTAALPPAALRRLRVHRRLAVTAENAMPVTLRRGQWRLNVPTAGRDPRQ